MKLLNKILLHLCFLIIVANTFSANKLDSLFWELKKAKSDTIIWSQYLKIGDYYENTNPDSAFFYYNKSLIHAVKNRLKKQEATSLLYIGFVFEDIGNFEKAIAYYSTALKKYEKINDQIGLSRCYNNLGIVYSYLGYNKVAMSYFNIALQLFKKQKDINGISNCLTNIGLIYSDEGNYENALKYLETSLSLFKEMKDQVGM
ncbi:MAG: tetratricopeptide repeat protein [Bacteroidales bacterium]|nr:tetratricopeptide repeat protein [Bacteroidales bacterium]